MVIGALLGSVWGPGAEAIGWIGDLFIRLIRMIVVPLVFVTIVSGVVSMGDPSKLGSLGAKTLILYMLTTLAAITIGLILAVFLQPGVGVDLTGAPASTLQKPFPVGTPDFDCAGKSDRCSGRRQHPCHHILRYPDRCRSAVGRRVWQASGGFHGRIERGGTAHYPLDHGNRPIWCSGSDCEGDWCSGV